MDDATKTTRFRFWLWLIALIGVIVPRRLRADWRQEWEAELRYRERLLAEWDRLDWRNKLELLRRSLAAFWDALVLQPQRLEEEMFQDLRFGLRMLLKAKGFTLIAALALAVGVGATTAVFSVVRSILLRPLPYAAPDRLALVWGTNRQAGQLRDVVSGPNFLDLQKQNSTFERLAAFTATEMAARNEEGIGVIPRLEVTTEFFSVLGAQPLLGRAFEPEDGLPGRNQVALLTYEYWQRRFGADPEIVGKTLAPLGQPHTVIGVLPPSFQFAVRPAVVTPLALNVMEQEERTYYYYWVVGRLKEGSSFAQAEQDLNGIMRRIAQQFPSLRNWEVTVNPLQQALVEPVRPALLTALAAVGLVLLIGCVNVANLLLSRGVERKRELAIRAALGAGRARLIRQMLTECALLASFAGLLGVGLAVWVVGWLRQALPGSVAIADSAAMVALPSISVDGVALAFGVALAALTVLLAGALPALKSTAAPIDAALKAATAKGAGAGQGARNALVAVEAAFATALLIVAGLTLRTVFALTGSDPGFRPDNVLAMNVGRLHDLGAAERARYYGEIVRAVQSVPGVKAAGLNDYVLLQNEDDYEGFNIEGRPRPQPGASPREEWRRVSPDYFRALDIPLVKGRGFTENDNATAPSVVIINQALARKYWPDEDPIGRRIRIHQRAYDRSEVIGIIGDVREVGLDKPAKPMLFVPYHRAPRPVMGLFAQSAEPADRMLAAIQRAVWSVPPTQPIYNVHSLERIVSDSISVQRLALNISAALAALALLLTAAGIYSVISYATARRTREIGLRMALGAQRRDVFRLVVSQGMRPAALGVACGLACALGATRLIKSQLYGVSAADPLTFAGAALLLAGVALLACYAPARRAARVDPMTALRHD
jgi:putative ABC transport system permease protein